MVRRSRCAMEAQMDDRVLSKRDTYRTITDMIVAAIEAGVGDYRMPWHRHGPTISRPINAVTGKTYQGVNVVALWADATAKHFGSGYWATYRQWQQLGVQVRKGAKGSPIVFFKAVEHAQNGSEGDDPKPRLIARTSWVFNAEQVDGWTAPMPETRSEVEIRGHVEAFIHATRADIRYGGDLACYDVPGDYIAIPHPEQFVATETSSATEGFYSVQLHELVHWSGAGHRLDRVLRSRFGDEAYAMEEMVAEFGAAFLCADLHIANEPRLDHACYVSTWLRVLNQDRTALFTAANKANAAVAYLSFLAAGVPAAR
jgi:antirestriction protein ArdC